MSPLSRVIRWCLDNLPQVLERCETLACTEVTVEVRQPGLRANEARPRVVSEPSQALVTRALHRVEVTQFEIQIGELVVEVAPGRLRDLGTELLDASVELLLLRVLQELLQLLRVRKQREALLGKHQRAVVHAEVDVDLPEIDEGRRGGALMDPSLQALQLLSDLELLAEVHRATSVR